MYTKLANQNEVSADERDRLILEHLPQVKLIASRIHDKLPSSVVLDDLVSAGVLGLIDAVDHFDRTMNVKLKTYAEHKIRGAILDSLRSLDWAPRNKRRKAKLIEQPSRSRNGDYNARRPKKKSPSRWRSPWWSIAAGSLKRAVSIWLRSNSREGVIAKEPMC